MKYLLFLISSLQLIQTWACDVCSVYEYSNIQNYSYIGAFYRNRVFNGYNNESFSSSFTPKSKLRTQHIPDKNLIYIPSTKDYEIYSSIELRGNFNFKKKYNLFFLLPYNVYDSYYDELYTTLGDREVLYTHNEGIGDLSLALDRLKEFENKNTLNRIKYGLGLGVPLSKIQLYNSTGTFIDPTHQPSTGAFTFSIRLNHTLSIKQKYGLNQLLYFNMSSNSFEKNSSTFSGEKYRFSNRLTYQCNLFYIIGLVNKIIPQLGIYVENSPRNSLNKIAVQSTGGTSVLFNIGSDVVIKDFTFQVMFQKPIFQKLHDIQFLNAGRLSIGFLYFFSKKETEIPSH